MSEPFLSEIKIVSFNFAPKGWALCNGQFLPINQNQALFALLGTTYGGNGQTTFALPNLRGRVPDPRGQRPHARRGRRQHQRHDQPADDAAAPSLRAGLHAAAPAPPRRTAPSCSAAARPTTSTRRFAAAASLAGGTVTNVGGSQPHNNMMPYLVLNFFIALQGIFPSQN